MKIYNFNEYIPKHHRIKTNPSEWMDLDRGDNLIVSQLNLSSMLRT